MRRSCVVIAVCNKLPTRLAILIDGRLHLIARLLAVDRAYTAILIIRYCRRFSAMPIGSLAALTS